MAEIGPGPVGAIATFDDLTPGTYTTGPVFSTGLGSVEGVTLTIQQASSAAVPEPSTFAVLAVGCIGFGIHRRRRHSTVEAKVSDCQPA